MIQPDPLHLEKVLHTPVRRIRPYRNNWCIETDFMWWIAKPVPGSKAKWWHQVDSELRNRGFHSMLPMITDGYQWILTPFIQGQSCKYNKMSEVKRMVKTLAHFHRVGRNLRTPPPEAAFLLSHRLVNRLQKFHRLLLSADQVKSPLRELLLKTGKDFYLDGIEAWKRLEKLPFQDWIERERSHHVLAHRDLASHNWMTDQTGALWLIDFETADYDAQVGDVWQMSTRILAANQYPERGIETILRAYEMVRPLAGIEKKILAALFLYPNEFFREMIGLVERKRGYEIKVSYPYLKQIACNRKKWKKQIAEFMYW
ncbi:phosphotransferase [Thermoactinomyces mirandus]|uniref:Phosphotransferase n=1 Tax=Thermoactinomyces mirandus TaxID=2756294 RepID=A0A7W1XPG7_9BACL|nr:phosphotransferase [Thermoactinomyces mirandus]MBA4600824.1 phosphotransferase [Thermoactinomyces mirandus]